MANSSDEMTDSKFSSNHNQDVKKKTTVKFTRKQEKENISSSSSSDDNDDLDMINPNYSTTYMSSNQAQQQRSNQTLNSLNVNTTSSSRSKASSSSAKKQRAVWEVIEGYRDPNMKVAKPQNHEGVLLKRRNWPMKGWHKRYFILADGILTYGKNKTDLTKNKDKPHGILNTFLSIVSYMPSKRRILIDSSTHTSAVVCHLKARTQQEFETWLELLKHHRLYYQYKWSHASPVTTPPVSSTHSTTTNATTASPISTTLAAAMATTVTAITPIAQNQTSQSLSVIEESFGSGGGGGQSRENHRTGVASLQSSQSSSGLTFQNNTLTSLEGGSNRQTLNDGDLGQVGKNNEVTKSKKPPTTIVTPTRAANLHPAVMDENTLENHFKQVEDGLMGLSKILSAVYLSTLSTSTSTLNQTTTSNGNLNSGNNNGTIINPVGLIVPSISSAQQHFNSSFNNSGHQYQPSSSSFDYVSSAAAAVNSLNASSKIHASKSNPNLINNETMLPGGLAANITGSLVGNANSVVSNAVTSGINSSSAKKPPVVATLPSTTSCYSSNDERQIGFYQEAKSINEQLIFIYQQLMLKKQSLYNSPNANATLDNSMISRAHRSQSVMSSVSLQDSQLQFYDAIEYFTSDTESDDDSDQETSDVETNEAITQMCKTVKQAIVPEELQAQKIMTRRRKLPAPCPDASQVSIWGIMRKAIGKDLSKISLPVILNEPLSILQRLCEELEYSDLIDTAAQCQDPFDRMVYVAAFVISSYSSSYYRTGAKNFNPLLGETYELTRPDKGWKYVAEQVSHHPPVSACYCQSKNFVHEQIFHAKIKFWGKSMEIHPEGYTRLTLPKFNETYQWNKIVMYVHNVMGSSRRIEHYGEITIRCTNGTFCSITFPKSSNSSQKNEFYGDIISDNIVKRKIFGQWHESFLCGTDNTAKTIWRMGAMPEDASLYYGFTRFAIELNEITEDMQNELPPTDTRFRPDQRYLENGDVEKAEMEKHRIEEMQRTRRREMEARGDKHDPLWFKSANTTTTSGCKEEKEWTFTNTYWARREAPGGFKSLKPEFFPVIW